MSQMKPHEESTEIVISIAGMHCAGCAGRIDRTLSQLDGAQDVAVSFATQEARLRISPSRLAVDTVLSTIDRLGFQGTYTAPEDAKDLLGAHFDAIDRTEDKQRQQRIHRLWLAIALSLPLFVIAMLGDMTHLLGPFPTSEWAGRKPFHMLQWLLATPVQFVAGWPFISGAARALRQRSADMDTLVALGTLAAWTYSSAITWWPTLATEPAHVYFESGAVIITLVLLGRVLEGNARRKTQGALRGLLQLQPTLAHRIDAATGAEVDTPPDRLQLGDCVRVRPGERVPVDAVIIEGRSEIDTAMMTGEPLPKPVTVGDEVLAGTVNHAGAFVAQASRVGAHTLLARIITQVRNAQASRAPIQRTADRVAARFVPVVLVVALLTLIAWLAFGPQPQTAYALTAALAVLIIACPCALGLATPAAIVVGTGVGARHGLLFANAEALERLQRCDTVILDKTGTLTEGRPQVTQALWTPELHPQPSLALAVAVESASEHPLARALRDHGQRLGVEPLPVDDFAALPGQGVSGQVAGRQVRVGTLAWLAPAAPPPPELLAARDQAHALGQSLVWVEIDGAIAGIIAFADQLTATAPAAVAALRALDKRIIMATGDHRAAADTIAAASGIDAVHASQSPHDKAALVQHLKAQGRLVAMVGDGINDAPALALADVGIAMGHGADLAMGTAGLTLVRSDLSALVDALRLSTRTMQIIRQNLFFAFIYNICAIPVAAGLLFPLTGHLLSPMIAAAAMAASSLSVLGNALRLRRFAPYGKDIQASGIALASAREPS